MKSRMKDTLLLIGDAASDRGNLHAIFENSFYLLEAETARQGIVLLEQNKHCIAAVIADLPTEEDSGLRELVAAASSSGAAEIPVVCLISPTGTGQREETAFLMGVEDVVHKPYATLSIRRRVQVLVDLHAHRWHLETLVEEQSRAIRNTNQSMVDTLSAIIEHRSTESGYHVMRIRGFTQSLLQEVARSCPEYELNDIEIDRIASASALHDIGKISIPDNILSKPGPLTPEEFQIMQTHTTVGSRLTEQIGDIGDPMYLRYIYNICLYHHERWDGKGYPEGLRGNQIPICAQVVGLADAYDALTTPRVYKPAFSHEKAVNMILNGECGIFSPKLLECFKRVRGQFAQLVQQYADSEVPNSEDIRLPLPPPVPKEHSLTALELAQIKYQTMLHYLNDTVIELDIDNRNYHVIYNPHPDLMAPLAHASFEELSGQLLQDPSSEADQAYLLQIRRELNEKLFLGNQRLITFRRSIYSHTYQAAFPYEVTLLRVNTGVPTQRIVIAVFHRLMGQEALAEQRGLPSGTALQSLSDGTLCCTGDGPLTIREGGDTLFLLTGFRPQELESQFGNSLLQLVHPADRAKVLKTLSGETLSGGKFRCAYRLQRKNGDPVWVLDICRASIATDGTGVSHHLLVEITEEKARERQLLDKVALHESLVDLSEGIILEWNLLDGSVYCSSRWLQRFGYPITEILTPDLRDAVHVHPDDAPKLRETFLAITEGRASSFTDIRIANADGRYLWSRVRAKAIFGNDGAPIRITCILYDIDELKADALAMKRQAERDGLTNLLNKASAQQAVSEYLANADPDRRSALLVMDLDNFKAVNDTLGHMYGDAVLTQISATLRNLFRARDVISRIGGDEFMILLKDIPGRDIVEDRCQLLVDTFRDQLHRLMPNLPVSVSVGAALSPNHGTTYGDLFRHADEALYVAKGSGKCQYRIYDAADAFPALSRATRIDSDEHPDMTNESMMRYVFQHLYESRDLDATINSLLAFIGTHFHVSRVYIFENNEDNTACSNTFEWCNTGIQPEKDNLQNLNYQTDLAGWPELYKDTGVLYCTDITTLAPHFRQILEPQGIKSMLHCAIMDRGVFRGYVGFDECTATCLWTQGQVDMLKILAEMMAVFLIKQRSADKQ